MKKVSSASSSYLSCSAYFYTCKAILNFIWKLFTYKSSVLCGNFIRFTKFHFAGSVGSGKRFVKASGPAVDAAELHSWICPSAFYFDLEMAGILFCFSSPIRRIDNRLTLDLVSRPDAILSLWVLSGWLRMHRNTTTFQTQPLPRSV